MDSPPLISTSSRARSRPTNRKSLREFDLIARLCANLPQSRRTILGPGDDCAILAGARFPQLVTIDSMVEGVHFRLDWTTPELLGARALTVNLSDLAAMGGAPRAAFVNLGIRDGLDQRFFDRLYRGLRRQAAAAGVDIGGGNITTCTQLTITIALIGEARGPIMRRDSARPGDAVFVTGALGDAALGLSLLAGKRRAGGAARKYLVDRMLAPTARLDEARRLARLKPTPAAIDISDGLWQDLGHLLARSKVGAEIDAGAIPLSAAYRAVAGDDPTVALSGGDDYELLFCAAARNSPAMLTHRLGVPVSRIGTIIEETRAQLVLNGKRVKAPILGGWDQLRRGAP